MTYGIRSCFQKITGGAKGEAGRVVRRLLTSVRLKGTSSLSLGLSYLECLFFEEKLNPGGLPEVRQLERGSPGLPPHSPTQAQTSSPPPTRSHGYYWVHRPSTCSQLSCEVGNQLFVLPLQLRKLRLKEAESLPQRGRMGGKLQCSCSRHYQEK